MKTRTKILLGFIALPLLPIVGIIMLVLLGYGYLIWNVYTYSEDLELIDNSAYIFCQNIASNPKFTHEPVYFRIDKGSIIIEAGKRIAPGETLAVTPVLLWPYGKTIFLTEKALKDPYLDFIVAHELGHIQHVADGRKFANLVEQEQEADIFAAEIVGTQRVLESRFPPTK